MWNVFSTGLELKSRTYLLHNHNCALSVFSKLFPAEEYGNDTAEKSVE